MSKIGLNIGNVYDVISTPLTLKEIENSKLEPNKMIVSCETTDTGVDSSNAILAGITDNNGNLNKIQIDDPIIDSIGKVFAYSIVTRKFPEYKFDDTTDIIYRNITTNGKTITSKTPTISFSYTYCFTPKNVFDNFITVLTTASQQKDSPTINTTLTLNTDIDTIKYGTFNGRIEIFPNIYKDVIINITNTSSISMYLWTIPYFIDKANNTDTLFNNISYNLSQPINPEQYKPIGISELQQYNWANVNQEQSYSQSVSILYDTYYDIANILGNNYIEEAWGPTIYDYYNNSNNYINKLGHNNILYDSNYTTYSSVNVNNLYIGVNKKSLDSTNDITFGISYIISDESSHIIRMTSNRFSNNSYYWIKESLSDVIVDIINNNPTIGWNGYPNIIIHRSDYDDSYYNYNSSDSYYTVRSILWEMLENGYFAEDIISINNNLKISYFINNYNNSNSFSISKYTHLHEYKINYDLRVTNKVFKENDKENDPTKYVSIYKLPLMQYYKGEYARFSDYIKLNHPNSDKDYNYEINNSGNISKIWESFVKKFKLIDNDIEFDDTEKQQYKQSITKDFILNHLLPDFASNNKKYGITLFNDYIYPKVYVKVIGKK